MPTLLEPDHTRAATRHQPELVDVPPTRVLLVDDETAILRALTRLLRREPYDLRTATSGEEALDLLRESPADLVLSDYRMPGMTGTQFLQQVRLHWPHTIRLILSGYAEVHAILNAINDGEVYKYLTKPWNDDELKLHLRRAIEQHALLAENQQLNQRIETQNHELRAVNEQLEVAHRDAMLGLRISQQLIETVSAGVLCIDEDRTVVAVNARFAELLGLEAGDLLGQPLSDALPEPLHRLLHNTTTHHHDELCLGFHHYAQDLQACCRTFRLGNQSHGHALTLWQVIP